jgi:hypothetical protein
MVTVLIALIGLAILVWGLIQFVAFGIAMRVFGRLQSTGAYTTVKESGAVKTGEAFVGRAVDAIQNAFVRRLVRRVVPEGSDITGTFITDLLQEKRGLGKWVAILGAAVFAASFVAGPWLTNLIARG